MADRVKKFYFYLYGDEFTLRTDYMPFESLGTFRNAIARIMRWAQYLQQFRIRVQYIRGADNVGVDLLLRLPTNCGSDTERQDAIRRAVFESSNES